VRVVKKISLPSVFPSRTRRRPILPRRGALRRVDAYRCQPVSVSRRYSFRCLRRPDHAVPLSDIAWRMSLLSSAYPEFCLHGIASFERFFSFCFLFFCSAYGSS